MVGDKGQHTLAGLVVMFLVGTGGFLAYHVYLSGATQNILIRVDTAEQQQECQFTLFSLYDDYLKYGGVEKLSGNKEKLEEFYENISGEEFPITRYSDKRLAYKAYQPDTSIYEGSGGICDVRVFDPYLIYKKGFESYQSLTMTRKK